jgi:hypothetical protein
VKSGKAAGEPPWATDATLSGKTLDHAAAESLFQDIHRLFEHEDLQAFARHS